jgi:tetratricopeptide (TPR) repeat protein
MDEVVQRQLREAQSHLAAVTRERGVTKRELAEAYGSLGELYHAYGLDPAASDCYLNAESLDPGEFKWPYYLGVLYRNQGDIKRAAVYFETALKVRSSDEITLLRLAEAKLDLNRRQEAKSLYERVLALDKSSVPAMVGLGKAALAERNFAAAVEYFNQVLAIDPEASYVQYPLAMAYRGLGNFKQAQAHLPKQGPGAPKVPDLLLEELERLKTGKADIWSKGYRAVSEGRFTEGAEAFRKVVSMTPQDPVARTYLGTALARAGDSNGAIQQFSEALRIAPQNAQAHYCLGVVLLDLGRDENAIRHLQAAIESDPQYTEAHFQLANLLMRSGQYEAAAQEYARVAAADPSNGFAGLMRAMALVRVKNYRDARAQLEQLHAGMPENADIAGALARLLAACPENHVRDGPRALRLIQELIRAQKSVDVDQGQTLAMALAEVGQFQEAVAVQRRIIGVLERENQPDLLPLLREDLALYGRGQPSRVPWRSGDPIFFPVPKKLELPPENLPRAHASSSQR